MDFRDNTQEAAFRQEVRSFIKNDVQADEQASELAERGMYRGAFARHAHRVPRSVEVRDRADRASGA
jgi:hypothetical protein